jgi:hypothetical protein
MQRGIQGRTEGPGNIFVEDAAGRTQKPKGFGKQKPSYL